MLLPGLFEAPGRQVPPAGHYEDLNRTGRWLSDAKRPRGTHRGAVEEGVGLYQVPLQALQAPEGGVPGPMPAICIQTAPLACSLSTLSSPVQYRMTPVV